MILPRIIADIAFKAAQREYETTRRLGGTAQEATIAGCKVMLDIRQIATDGEEAAKEQISAMIYAAADGWWMGS